MSTTIQEGHPRGLYVLFFSEMWERFCYYGMRVLLTLFLVKSLLKGDAEASLLYGAYTGLIYAAPILGGKMADKFLGYRWAVILGGILMSIGEFLILGGNEMFLMVGMGALIVGNGYFKANISTIVGKLYKDGDPRRDSGFTIFYIGINVGALLATTVVAIVGDVYGFDKGFALAGLGMLAGIIIFWVGREKYSAAPGLDVTEAGKKKVFGPINMATIISIGSLALIPLCYLLILNNGWLNGIFLALFIGVAYSLISAGIKEDKAEGTSIWKDRMIALIIFMLINITFWACFEQAGTSLTLFADRNVDREVLGWIMPATMTQFFNPFFIILFGSVFSVMWMKLSAMGKNPNIPLKFAFGIIQLALGFLLTYVGFILSENNLVPLFIVMFLYMLHTTGELFLSPIGLSMVTKLAPKKMAGTAMGAWFLSFAIANLLGGQIATLTSGGHGGGSSDSEEGFTMEATVEDALAASNAGDLASWPVFYEVTEDLDISTKKKKEVEVSKNITVGKYLSIRDWVLVRNQLDAGVTFEEFLASKESLDIPESEDEWLQSDWSSLRTRYSALIAEDFKAGRSEDRPDPLSLSDWNYFKGGIEGMRETDADKPLSQVLSTQINKVQEARLTKYVDVFTKLGFVLLGIALIIILVNKPLQRLMHGVN